jgi:hypothetical protein
LVSALRGDGYRVYIKQAEGYPYKRALLEIHREPGVGMALTGALIFTVGIALVVWMRSRPRESGLVEVENEVVSQGIVV